MPQHDPDTSSHATADEYERPLAIGRFFDIIYRYRTIIAGVVAGVAILYAIAALGIYLSAPTHRTTSQAFRVEFRGAEVGEYPNGTKFSSTDIVATPILLTVFNDNQLQRFTVFEDFSRAIVVLESNPAYELLAAEFSARLKQTNLTPVDRERIEKEFEQRRGSLSKNDYAITWARTERTRQIPETVVRKVLTDILNTWARLAINERRVLEYRLDILSPEIVTAGSLEKANAIVAIQVLRSKVGKILENIDELAQIPGTDMLRGREGLSLAEIRLRLEEISRYRLDYPLVGLARATGSFDSVSTLGFLESQLRYDQRQLRIYQQQVESIREALAVYSMERPTVLAGSSGLSEVPPTGRQKQEKSERGVTTQLSDSFIDRLVALTTQSADLTYRQRLVDDLRKASALIGPAQEDVAYDQALLASMRQPVSGAGSTPEAVRAQIEETRAEVRSYVAKLNEIHQVLSRVLNPTAQLLSLSGTPVVRVERTVDGRRLLLAGVMLLLITIPVTVVLSLIHYRVRSEKGTDLAEGAPIASEREHEHDPAPI